MAVSNVNFKIKLVNTHTCHYQHSVSPRISIKLQDIRLCTQAKARRLGCIILCIRCNRLVNNVHIV